MEDEKPTSHRITDELAEQARRANAMFIEVLSRPYPYPLEARDEPDPDALSHQQIMDQWVERGRREYKDKKPLFLDAVNWISQLIDEGKEPEQCVAAIRRVLTLLLAAEHIDVLSVYVGTIATVYPLLSVFHDFTGCSVFNHDADLEAPEDDTGSWDYQMIAALSTAQPIYATLYQDEPIEKLEEDEPVRE